ncbi:MAG: excisionase family DNA-binding protein [Proteobacteria bacterium]|nr:excisionase family DNA-binding protein [Pseudomonadota bacterium]
MTRTRSTPSAESVAVVGRLRRAPGGPLEPLARAVEHALRQRAAATGLRSRAVLGVIAQALEETVSAETAEGHSLRMALIAKLAGQEAARPGGAAVARPTDAALLTTAQAAALLQVSRPYVSMLCDAGKLGEVTVTEGGHRRVRAAAVDAYRAAQVRAAQGARTPRQAGVDAGLYQHRDDHYVNVVREQDAAATGRKRQRKTRP